MMRASSMEAVKADLRFAPALSEGSAVKVWRWENDPMLAMVRHCSPTHCSAGPNSPA